MQGNNIFSADEEAMALFLKEKNLNNANAMASSVKPNINLYSKYGKRFLDLLITVPIVIILSPIFGILAIANIIDLGKPILYKQTRYGYKGNNYDILKFRSMKNSVDSDGRQLPPDKRLTRYGKFIRKYSLDELPNFINVVKGDMSIIGPRAVPVFYMERMTERHKQMTYVRPGLECPRMIKPELGSDISNYQSTFENNIWYVENISFVTDIRMIFRLIKMVFSLGERSKHADAASFFVGYDEEGRAISMKLAEKKYSNIHQQS